MTIAAAAARPLAEALGHRFAQPELLTEALTHPSARCAGARSARRGYERLEFLGDRVLGLVVAELLWRRFPDEAEGDADAAPHRAGAPRGAGRVARDDRARPPSSCCRAGEEAAGARDNPACSPMSARR